MARAVAINSKTFYYSNFIIIKYNKNHSFSSCLSASKFFVSGIQESLLKEIQVLFWPKNY